MIARGKKAVREETEFQKNIYLSVIYWRTRRDSNSRPLPSEDSGQLFFYIYSCFIAIYKML